MNDEEWMLKLETVVKRAWADGCPVAGPSSQAELARTALRRWRSFSRRQPTTPSFDARVDDLAKGLRDSIEPDPVLVGPLMNDYRWLATQLANELREIK